MTTKRTSKESANSRFSDTYKFKRLLKTAPEITVAYKDRDERINRVPPVKDILVLDIFESAAEHLSRVLGQTDYPIEQKTMDTVPITRDQHEWPFRLEYIEQLLSVQNIWVVMVDAINQTPTEGPAELRDIAIDVVHIHRPAVFVEYSRTFSNAPEPLLTEGELLQLEEDESHGMMIFSQHHASIRSLEDSKAIDIYDCNILPHRLSFYNATFYNRDVAHLYVDSISEHLKRYTR